VGKLVLVLILMTGCHISHDAADVGDESPSEVDGGLEPDASPSLSLEPSIDLVQAASEAFPGNPDEMPDATLEGPSEAPEGPAIEPENPSPSMPPSEPMAFVGRAWSVVSTPTSKASTFGSNQKPCEGVQLPVLEETWTVSVAHGELFVARTGRSYLTGVMKLPNVYQLGNSDSYGLPISGVQRWTINMDSSGFSGSAWVWLPELGCGGSYEVLGRPE
jgi:hypothetical protein